MKQFSSLEQEQARGTLDKSEIQMPNRERMTKREFQRVFGWVMPWGFVIQISFVIRHPESVNPKIIKYLSGAERGAGHLGAAL